MNYLYFTNQNGMNMHGLHVFFPILYIYIIHTYTHVHGCMCMYDIPPLLKTYVLPKANVWYVPPCENPLQ